MFSSLISPAELHERAVALVKEEKPVESLPLFKTVLGFINGSSGVSRAEAPFCGVYTTEYTLIPVPGSMLEEEAPRIINALREHGYFVTLKDDALSRFKEESLMVVCWDPRVIAASEAGHDANEMPALHGKCILPGKQENECTHCYDCVQYFTAQHDNSAAEEGASAG